MIPFIISCYGLSPIDLSSDYLDGDTTDILLSSPQQLDCSLSAPLKTTSLRRPPPHRTQAIAENREHLSSHGPLPATNLAHFHSRRLSSLADVHVINHLKLMWHHVLHRVNGASMSPIRLMHHHVPKRNTMNIIARCASNCRYYSKRAVGTDLLHEVKLYVRQRHGTPCTAAGSLTAFDSIQHREYGRFNSSYEHVTHRRFSSSSAIHSHEYNRNVGAMNDEEQRELLPQGILRQADFFGEAVTFVKNVNADSILSVGTSYTTKAKGGGGDCSTLRKQHHTQSTSKEVDNNISEVVSSFDNMSLVIISKGSANIHDGNDGMGPDSRAMHASAMAWSDMLRYSSDWNGSQGEGITSAPMLAVAAVAPVVAQGGVQYLRRVDRLLAMTYPVSPPSLLDMAHHATSFRDAFISLSESKTQSTAPLLTPRERWHLHALHQLLQNNHQQAMGAYLRLLELFPGDLLGLSLALDVAYTLGDAGSALR